MLTRRHFVRTSATAFSAVTLGSLAAPTLAPDHGVAHAAPRPSPAQKAAWDAQVTPPNYDPATSNPWGVHPRLLPQRVERHDGLVPGDIHVDAIARYLYHIEEGGTAMRYGVAIGKDGLYEPGIYTLRRKVKWPRWTPTASMIARDPIGLAPYVDGMDPGPQNALGSRALYLFVGNRDTYLRIHGTPYPRSIGARASSGCVRMIMPHINDLYQQVRTGGTVYLHPAEGVAR